MSYKSKVVVMKFFPQWKNVSLRAKSTLLIEGLVVTIVLVTGIITTMREKKTLESELERRGLALAVDLAKFSSRPLLSDDLPTLRRFIRHYLEQDYVRYAILLDHQGKVVMHSDLAEVGKAFNDSLSMAALASDEPGCTHARVSEMGERYCDIFAPIELASVRLGTVRLGYSHRAAEKEIAVAQRQILVIGLVTAIIGGVLAYLLAGLISSPIKRITNAIGKVAKGDLDTMLTIKGNDEVGALADSVNKMTKDLRKSTISKDYVDNIIGSMNDTLIVADLDAKITSVNRATCELLGYAEQELVGRDISLIVGEEERAFRAETMKNLHGGKTVMNREVAYVTRLGKRIPMLFSAALLRDKGGKIVGVVGLARDIEERKRAEEALRESERRLRFLSTQLLTVQEEERKRLSAELHDELGQALILFKIQVRSIRAALGPDQAEVKGVCDELIGYINEVSENTRRLYRDLSPAILEDLGFLAAIRRLVNGFAKRCNVRTSLEMADIEDLLPQEAQIIAYRIMQECFTNIAKHSQATSASVEIGRQDGQLVFRVQDDGQGFNVEEVIGRDPIEKGLGLAAMLERARMLKGSCDIQSQRGVGTVITCMIPIDDGEPRS
jgi:PAS domain S-box-containing protein